MRPILLLSLLLGINTCQAALVFTLEEVGPDVVFTGSGSANTAALSTGGTTGASSARISASAAFFLFETGTIRVYSVISGPTSIGPGGGLFSVADTGDAFGVYGGGAGIVYLPNGYVSGSPLFNTATFPGQSLASIGLTPGTYVWTWGSGATADSATLTVIPASVIPEPSTYIALAGFAGLGLLVWRRRKVRAHQRG
ncbi:PEP-CTERM sorting domain-containing protein [Cerasicoccus fimbriatus]|uniref:PEP-CTERM sorting domain-containing protein n=1 Tax=Cerasicoccus fimbriatus TaxID=3014554 RepID=UPI0022B5A453|nr:PEP-CTERM sorting domain-containing protein [Cerasicoccus sp. TK19100]